MPNIHWIKSSIVRLAAIWIAVLIVCCAISSPLLCQSNEPGADPSTHLLGPEDQIVIHALHAQEISEKPVRVDPAGNIRLPLIGQIHAAGMTLGQLQQELVAHLKAHVQQPEVSVEMVEHKSQPVSVVGAVKNPGVYQLQGEKTLIEMISAAGGADPDAGSVVKITRRRAWGSIPLPGAGLDDSGEFTVAEVSLQSLIAASNPIENLSIYPHDVISVPRAKLVYAIGEVHKSGGFVLREQETISVLQVLSLAEGLQQTAAREHAKILRTVPGSRQRVELPVNLKQIMSGRAEDVALHPNDILFVPNSAARSAALRTLEAAIQMGTGVVIWRR